MPSKSASKPTSTPKVDARIGRIDKVPIPPPIDHPPKVPKHGLCPKPTDPVDKLPKGATMMVRSNYVRVSKVPKTLYVYSLTFHRTTGKGVRMDYNKRREIREIYKVLMDHDVLKLKADDVKSVTDFKILWTTKPIHDRPEKNYTFNSEEFEYTQQDGKLVKNMKAVVSYVDQLSNIEEALRTQHIKDLPEYIRALNANVAQCIVDHSEKTRRDISRVGVNKFFITNGYKDMGGLRACRGYFTSIRPGTDSTLLNVNPATSAFLSPVTVSDFIRTIGTNKLGYVSELLQGATLKIRYIRTNYAESDIDYNSEEARLKVFAQIGPYFAHQQKFYELEDKVAGQPRITKASDRGTTVENYLRKQARVQFPAGTSSTSPEMYCINVGERVETLRTNIQEVKTPDDRLMRRQSAKGARWIPACLLQIVPGQAVTTTLGPAHTSKMITHALRLPAENVGLIEEEGLEIMGVRADQEGVKPLASMGFAVDDELIEVPATRLPLPKLTYDQSLVKTIKLGSWDLKGVKFAAPAVKFRSFSILAMPGSFNNTHDALTIVYGKFVTILEGHGLKFDNGVSTEQVCTKESLFKENVKENEDPDDTIIVKKFFNTKVKTSEDCGLILIPEKCYDTYAMAKRLADFSGRNVLLAIGSKMLEKNADQIMSNIALKINMRFGGDNHHFDRTEFDNVLSVGKRRNTIVIGADIAHCGSGGKDGSPSIVCLVGSNTAAFMSYPGSMRLQRGGQENIEGEHMYSMIQERLQAWADANPKPMHSSKKKGKKNADDGKWPTNMIFYRDGISESQFEDCENEIEVIKRAYRELCGREVTLTFIVGGKRHHTRFYATEMSQTYPQKIRSDDGQMQDGINGNVQPGLLVTSVVTNPEPYNFFLQSHKAIKGTARSAHYHVLEDGMALGSKIPQLTMMLCYAFGRATTGVSYAAPAYIADRLCERGRAYLRAWNLDPDMEPHFKAPEETDANGKRTRVSEETMNKAKKAFAEKLSNDQDIWGKNYGKEVDGGVWRNPWSNLLRERSGMFWM